jgi:hypothetical protein
VGLKSLKSLTLTNGYPNNKNKKKNNKVKSKPLKLFELAGKKKVSKRTISWVKMVQFFVAKMSHFLSWVFAKL